MKLTWFAKSCFRLHIGGRIIVTDPAKAPPGIAQHELVSGADSVLDLHANTLPHFAPAHWTQRRPVSFIDADSDPALSMFRFGANGLFLDPPGDAPLILVPAHAEWGRFADDAFVVLFGEFAGLPEAVAALTDAARPKAIAIAAQPDDEGFARLADAARGTVTQVLEPGLALEV